MYDTMKVMKNEDLIKELQKYPKDYNVRLVTNQLDLKDFYVEESDDITTENQTIIISAWEQWQ